MKRNEYLDHGSSEGDFSSDAGYDSEAAEITKTKKTERQGTKRRKLSHTPPDPDPDHKRRQPKVRTIDSSNGFYGHGASPTEQSVIEQEISHKEEEQVQGLPHKRKVSTAGPLVKNIEKRRVSKKEQIPGVVYLSSLPPYLKPSALRNLLAQSGFEPISRLFLTPSSKHKHSSKKSSRQLYSEGWIEFASKKTARACAEALNAQQVGGKKGGFYYDDLWNMKYLRGMSWDELMAGIREERREEEGRRDEERRKIAVETKAFVEGVEQGRKLDGMKRKKKSKESDIRHDDGMDVKRTWRQHELAPDGGKPAKGFSDEVQQILTRIL